MATVVAHMSMSLDGYVADPQDGINEVFSWFIGGEVTVPTANPQFNFQTDEASAQMWRETLENTGAVISGRRTFDLAGGWPGGHPMGVPVFVLTHNPPDDFDESHVTFVTDGVESAVEQARAAAGDKTVGIGGASAAQQCINARLADAIQVSLVPVLLGDGIPFFANLENAPLTLATPKVTEAQGVTHLYYELPSQA